VKNAIGGGSGCGTGEEVIEQLEGGDSCSADPENTQNRVGSRHGGRPWLKCTLGGYWIGS